MRENVKNFDIKRSTDFWTKVKDLRHTLIQYLSYNRMALELEKAKQKK